MKIVRDGKEYELTQEQVANRLGCKREVYRRYENGERELPLSYAIALAEMYSISIDFLVGLTDERKR